MIRLGWMMANCPSSCQSGWDKSMHVERTPILLHSVKEGILEEGEREEEGEEDDEEEGRGEWEGEGEEERDWRRC